MKKHTTGLKSFKHALQPTILELSDFIREKIVG